MSVSRRGFWVVFFLLLNAPTVLAQTLGGVQLALGSEEQPTLARLSRYLLTPSGTGGLKGFWSVSDTTQWHGVPYYGNVGSVQFGNGRLSVVNRSWAVPTGASVAATAQVIALLRQLEGRNNCAISNVRLTDPEASADMMKVDCDGHSVTIGVSDQDGHRYAHINETWMPSKR